MNNIHISFEYVSHKRREVPTYTKKIGDFCKGGEILNLFFLKFNVLGIEHFIEGIPTM